MTQETISSCLHNQTFTIFIENLYSKATYTSWMRCHSVFPSLFSSLALYLMPACDYILCTCASLELSTAETHAKCGALVPAILAGGSTFFVRSV